MTVYEYLRERGISLPCFDHSDRPEGCWSQWEASSNCGQDITKLWLTARPLLELALDTRPRLERVLVHQSDIYAYG